MGKVRSPNYPNIPLGAALEAVRPAYIKEHRNKMSRLVLAKHLGYNSLNGRALGKIGAIRAYGLIEGSGDELRISEDGQAAIAAPVGSSQKQEALGRLAGRPSLFADIRKQYPETHPSLDNLAFWLVTQGFTQKAAEKAAKSYLSTMSLAAGIPDPYTSSLDEEEGEDADPLAGIKVAPPTPAGAPPPSAGHRVKAMPSERELTTGLLSKDSNFRLLVSGPFGLKEIERLIAKLTLDKEILAEIAEEDE
jgi:hypothetical protein